MINFEMLGKAGLKETDYLLLVKVFQQDMHLLSEDDKPRIDYLLEEGYFVLLKGGKTLREKLRISPKGKAFLDNLQVADLTDEVIALDKRLCELYEDENKVTGKDTLKKLAWFKKVTGFRNEVIIKAVQEHLEDDSFTYILSNLIWKNENVFQAKWSLEGSYLFEKICKTFGFDRRVFTDKKDKEFHFLFNFGSTLPPKLKDKSLYFTGSYEGDCEHITKLAEMLTNKLRK